MMVPSSLAPGTVEMSESGSVTVGSVWSGERDLRREGGDAVSLRSYSGGSGSDTCMAAETRRDRGGMEKEREKRACGTT